MRRFTTPTITLTAEDVDLTSAKKVFVTFRQGSATVTKEDPPITYNGNDSIMDVTLTQEETGSFQSNGSVEIEINWLTEDGKRFPTDIVTVPVFRNLLSEARYG